MIHKFSFWRDVLYPLLCKLIGKKYGCCDRLKNCARCIKDNGWTE